jgi:Protein of unknown function (DUF3575)
MKNNRPMICRVCTLLLLISLLSGIAQAQEKLWVLRTSPLTLLQPNYPALHIGVEYKTTTRWSFLTDYGFKTPDILSTRNQLKTNIRQYKTRAEARYYFNGFFDRMYVATEFFYIAKSFTKTNDWYSNPEGNFNYSSAHIKTDELGIFFKIGHNTKIRFAFPKEIEEKIFLDLFMGVGPRWLWVKYFPVDATPIAIDTNMNQGQWATPIDQIEGHFLKSNFILGARLGYIISKK